jgi:hypothetical protein
MMPPAQGFFRLLALSSLRMPTNRRLSPTSAQQARTSQLGMDEYAEKVRRDFA